MTNEARGFAEARWRFADEMIGMFRTDEAGRLVDANPAFVAMLGYDSSEALLATDTLEQVACEREAWRGMILGCASLGRVGDVRMGLRRKDGIPITVRLRGEAAQDGSIQVIAEDVTETERLEEQLRHAQRMDAISQLAGGVAHDFNNLLTVIKGNADLMREELEADSELQRDLRCIRDAADAAAHLTSQLSALGKRKVMEPRLLDLNEQVAALEATLARVVPENIRIETVKTRDLGPVRADAGLLEQVFLNLIINARDAMPDGGRIAITTANAEIGAEAPRGPSEPAPGRYAVVAVTDTGVGMDAETARRVFEPFFTTKDNRQKGTGLGLSTAFGIVAQSRGKITVYSEPGKGSTFKVYLPLAAGESSTARSDRARTLRGAETVLVVEDGAEVRALVQKVLERRGYTVLVAEDGAQALELLAQHRDRLNLVITDLVMPLMSGRDLVRKVRAVLPDVKVLFMSGYAEQVQAVGDEEFGENESFLEKPFDPLSLALNVRRLLERGRHVTLS